MQFFQKSTIYTDFCVWYNIYKRRVNMKKTPKILIIGKVIGNVIVGIGQIVLWIISIIIGIVCGNLVSNYIARKDMIGATLYLAGEERKWSEVNQSYFKWREVIDALPCPICTRMILNAGIKDVVNTIGHVDMDMLYRRQ